MSDVAAAPRQVRVVDAPLAPPSANLGLLSVFHSRYLLRLLVRREVNARYAGSFMGLLWSYINPLSQFFIYWGVMGGILGLHDDLQNYPIHMFSGFVVVHFFIETFGGGTRSIVRNKGLVQKMAMPREMFPVAAMLVSMYHVLPQLIILIVACVCYGWTPDAATVAALALAVAIIAALGTALALLFSVANVFFRDFGSVVGILSHFVRFGVPMVYPFSMVTDRFGGLAPYYLIDPLADAVLLMQRAFWLGTTDRCAPGQASGSSCTDPATALPAHLWIDGLACLGAALVALLIAQVVFSKLENKIPERL